MLPNDDVPIEQRAAIVDVLWDMLVREWDEPTLRRIRGLLEIWAGRRTAAYKPLQSSPDIFLPDLNNDEPWFLDGFFCFQAQLEKSFDAIRQEFLVLRQKQPFMPYGRNPDDSPDVGPYAGNPDGWKQIKIMHNFEVLPRSRELTPTLAGIAASILDTYKVVTEFSILALQPDTEIPLHVDRANFLVSCHLGIDVPENCALEVAGIEKHWSDGKCISFNNSFQHRAYNYGDRTRYIVAVQALHPDTSTEERLAILKLVDCLKSIRARGAVLVGELPPVQ